VPTEDEEVEGEEVPVAEQDVTEVTATPDLFTEVEDNE
jgi:hypothetical protein